MSFTLIKIKKNSIKMDKKVVNIYEKRIKELAAMAHQINANAKKNKNKNKRKMKL